MDLVKEIGLDSVVTKAAGLVAADMDGEKVMLNIDKGKYYGLDVIGSRIWELLEKPQSVRDVVILLLKDFDVEDKICERDVLAFFRKLYAQGLVEIV